MYRKLPKYVRQTTTWSCWAAAMESWLDAQPYGRKATQAELIEEYATHPNGGLDPIGSGATADRSFERLADDFSMDYKVMAGSDLTLDFIDERLLKGHVILVYNLSPGVAHANVVYGVGRPTGKDRLISVMDPSEITGDKQTGLYRNRSIDFYKKRKVVIVAWPK